MKATKIYKLKPHSFKCLVVTPSLCWLLAQPRDSVIPGVCVTKAGHVKPIGGAIGLCRRSHSGDKGTAGLSALWGAAVDGGVCVSLPDQVNWTAGVEPVDVSVVSFLWREETTNCPWPLIASYGELWLKTWSYYCRETVSGEIYKNMQWYSSHSYYKSSVIRTAKTSLTNCVV